MTTSQNIPHRDCRARFDHLTLETATARIADLEHDYVLARQMLQFALKGWHAEKARAATIRRERDRLLSDLRAVRRVRQAA